MTHRALLATGLLAFAATAPRASADEILVFAAVSTAEAAREIGARFEAETGTQVRFSFGSSSDLARQIEAGARADLLLSADEAKMEQLERSGRVGPGRRVNLLSNRLVVVVPAASKLSLASPADLKRARRIALAEPSSVPAGIYARKWLLGLGLWAELEPLLIPTLDVRAAMAAVASENVDAGIVYSTDAALSPRVRVAYEVPKGEGPRIVYPVAVVGTPGREAAAKLVKFLQGPFARATFSRFGFEPL